MMWDIIKKSFDVSIQHITESVLPESPTPYQLPDDSSDQDGNRKSQDETKAQTAVQEVALAHPEQSDHGRQECLKVETYPRLYRYKHA